MLVAFVVGGAATYFYYSRWRNAQLDLLRSGSQIIETAIGPIEFVFTGEQGPVLLFIHGTPGGYDTSPSEWRKFRILTPSRPGYLSTPLEVGRTPAEQASAYALLLDALGVESVVVLGASGGGPSAISFAAMYPEKTRGLIAIEAVSQPYKSKAPGSLGAILQSLMQSDFFIWLMFRTLGEKRILAMAIPDSEQRQLLLNDSDSFRELKAVIWSTWPMSLRATGIENDTLQFSQMTLPIDEVTVPTLIVHGTEDNRAPFADSELLAKRIQHARFLAVEGAGHMMPWTHKEEVDVAINEFLLGHGLTDFVD